MIRILSGEVEQFSELGTLLMQRLTADHFLRLDEILSSETKETVGVKRVKRMLNDSAKWRLEELHVVARLLGEDEYEFFLKYHGFVEDINHHDLFKMVQERGAEMPNFLTQVSK